MWLLIVGVVCGVGAGFFIRDRTRKPQIAPAAAVAEQELPPNSEAEIKVLQKKLELLKEIETHKSQPRMNLVKKGKFESVSYNDEFYVRMDYSHNILWYKSKNTKNLDGNNLTLITDGETRRLLEGVWFNDVKKGNYD